MTGPPANSGTKAALNYEDESNRSFTIMVKATDPFNAEAEAQVTITVTDVNEAPSVTGVASIDVAENATDLDGTARTDQYTVTDADEDDGR